MPVRILHAADFHIDSPFDALPEDKAALRRKEQRELLGKIAELAQTERTEVLLLSGDLFDSDVSYYETADAVAQTFAGFGGRVFIAPGNHDYFCAKSPYAYMKLPENVHIFRAPAISGVSLPDLGCRVWGAGFNSPLSDPLLRGFRVEDDSVINLMALHGDTGGSNYNHISQEDIAGSGLDYLALGHIHAYSGILKAGGTAYAYPGCPEGRGFDETGPRGVIAGTVSKGGCDLRFVPLGGREYNVLRLDMTGESDPGAKLREAIPENAARDIYRVIFTGEFDGKLDIRGLAEACSDKFFHVTFRDGTRVCQDVWKGAGENSLRGLFLEKMRKKYDLAQTDGERQAAEAAVRYGLAALDRREEWRP